MSYISGTDLDDFLTVPLDGLSDTIVGRGGNDTILGESTDDHLQGDAGDDSVNGGAGDDYITGSEGNDTIIGGQGNDILYAGQGDDRVDGGRGHDQIEGNDGNDTIFGSWGNDTIYGADGADRIAGGWGNDIVFIGGGINRANGGAGIDMLSFFHATLEEIGIRLDLRDLSASSENVLIQDFRNFEAFEGTNYSDTLIGSSGDDTLLGGGGADTILGGAGDDFIANHGYSAQTWQSSNLRQTELGTVKSQATNSANFAMPDSREATFGTRLIGGAGNDTISSFDLGSYMVGGSGDDDIAGMGFIRAGSGNDRIFANEATVFAGRGNDTITESYGHDEINAGSGHDLVILDALHSFAFDNDIVRLGRGNDTVSVPTSSDNGEQVTSLDGGGGYDTLVINIGHSHLNLNTGARVVDFRLQQNGSWLDMGDLQIRDFEAVWYGATSKVQTVHFGNKNDVFVGSFSDYNNVYIYGHGGDDFLDSSSNVRSHLFGGRGDDRIVADGGIHANPNRAFGGQGDDFLFARNAQAGERTMLWGGSGADGFVFNSAGNLTGLEGPNARIMDFNLSEDWIGLNFYSYYPLSPADEAFDPMTTTRTNLEYSLLTDNADELVFTTQSTDFYTGEDVTNTVTYDRDTGRLTVQNDRYNGGNGEDPLAWIKGAPDLTIDHFYGMTTVEQSGQATVANTQPPNSIQSYDFQWDFS